MTKSIKEIFTDHLGSLSSKRIVGVLGITIGVLTIIVNWVLLSTGIINESIFTTIDDSAFQFTLLFSGIFSSTVLEKINFKK